MERGLDPSLVRSFIEAGVSGAGATVASLASATDDELRGINDTQAELLRHAQEFSTGVGDAYFGATITAQQAIVDQTKAAVDAAQKALTDARTAYDTERARLEAENTRLESEINALGAQIEAIIAHLAATLPPQTLAAGQAAVQSLIDGFNQKFPGMKREFGRLMDALAKSMERTTTITVRTVHEGAAVRASATTSTRSAVSGAPTVTPGTVPVFAPRSGRSVTIAPNAVSVNVNAGTSVDRAALTAQVRAAVDEGLQELAREIVAV
jgi:cell division protein FtsB